MTKHNYYFAIKKVNKKMKEVNIIDRFKKTTCKAEASNKIDRNRLKGCIFVISKICFIFM